MTINYWKKDLQRQRRNINFIEEMMYKLIDLSPEDIFELKGVRRQCRKIKWPWGNNIRGNNIIVTRKHIIKEIDDSGMEVTLHFNYRSTESCLWIFPNVRLSYGLESKHQECLRDTFKETRERYVESELCQIFDVMNIILGIPYLKKIKDKDKIINYCEILLASTAPDKRIVAREVLKRKDYIKF